MWGQDFLCLFRWLFPQGAQNSTWSLDNSTPPRCMTPVCPILKVFSMEGVPLWNAFILEQISVKCTFHECVFSPRLCTWLVFWALTFQEVYQSHHASLGWKVWEIFKIRNHRLRIIVCLKRVFLLLGIFSWQLPYKTEPWQFWLFLTPEIWFDTVWSSLQF